MVDTEWKNEMLMNERISSVMSGSIVVKYDEMKFTTNILPGGL